MHRSALLLAGLTLLAGCAGADHAPRTVAPAAAGQTDSLLGRVKALEGEWTMPNPEGGAPMLAAVFHTSSAGSAVREVMFPGSPQEMTNMYHMDGPSLVVTHYCAIGNQPRMRAEGVRGDSILFRFDDVTNLTDADTAVMAELTLVFKGPDNLEQHWRSLQNGVYTEPMVFELTRRK